MCGEGGADTDEEGLGRGLPTGELFLLAVAADNFCCLETLRCISIDNYDDDEHLSSLGNSLMRWQ